MKKFLLFLVIAISAISIGLSIYYFSIDNEVIHIKNSYLIVDKGDAISTDGLLEFKYRDENTKLTYSVSQESDVLSFNSGDGYFVADNAGESQIVINTTNKFYPKLVIDVMVCDGSEEYPYIISSSEQLSSIGNSEDYTLSSHYKLGNNIIFTESEEANWTPIANFSGVFDGNFYTISNIKIVDTLGSGSVGFISNLEKGGVVKNLFLDNFSLSTSASMYVGSVVGTNKGLVQTTEVKGVISSSNSSANYVGGIVGFNSYDGEQAKIDRCGFEGSIILTGNSLSQVSGGVAGYNLKSSISESYFRDAEGKNLENNNSMFGGIVGLNEGDSYVPASIYDSYFYIENLNDNLNFSNLAGVVYQNIQNEKYENKVLGNYFGGAYTNEQISNRCVAIGSKINEVTNGYLTVEQFANKNMQTTNFITYKTTDRKQIWDFRSVWSMGEKYPLLNIYSGVGSTYPDDITDIVGNDSITTAEDFYQKLANSDENSSYNVLNSIDFSSLVWGDKNHPIPDTFKGQLTFSDGVVLTNLKIVNDTQGANVGLFRTLDENAIISGLNLQGVIITGEKANSVGVIAGVNEGASLYNISIKDVSLTIEGVSFGTLFGISNDVQNKAIQNVKVESVGAGDVFFEYAGGLVGRNYGEISVVQNENNFIYNSVKNISLYAYVSGGVAGENNGKISYTMADEIKLNEDATVRKNIYDGVKDIAFGGVAGNNKGSITEVYTSVYLKLTSGADYSIFAGGAVGYNTGDITRVYSHDLHIEVKDNFASRLGGLVGFNNTGKISRSVVKGGDIVSLASTRSKSLFESNICSIAGGLVGYDYNTTASYSISECSVQIGSVEGFYAGGIVGIARGKLEKSYAGTSSSKVSVSGFIAGGISATIQGSVVDCYTICELAGEYTKNKYENVMSIINYEVSAVAGISVFVMTDGYVKGCYSVATFREGGEKFNAFADLSSKYNEGEIVGCIYTTNISNYPVKCNYLSESELNGSVGGYIEFFKKIGSDTTDIWVTNYSGYPEIRGLRENLPSYSPNA